MSVDNTNVRKHRHIDVEPFGLGVYGNVETGFLVVVAGKAALEIVVWSDGAVQDHVVIKIDEMLGKTFYAMHV